MTPLRIAFLGNDPWSVPTLEALATTAGSVEVALVITNPPRPAGRGAKLRPTAVAEAARAAGLPLLEAAGVRSGAGFDALRALEPDAIVVVAYGELLTPEVLGIPRLGCVNLHFSLLPRWRGAAPVQRAILHGDRVTGVTVMLMDEGLDTGPVVAAREVPVGTTEDAGALGARLARLGAEVLSASLADLGTGDVEPTPQPSTGARYAARILPPDRVIDWSRPAVEITRLIRALSPEPGARTTFRGTPLQILRAAPLTSLGSSLAGDTGGAITLQSDGGIQVDTGDGALQVLEVAPAGRKRMDAAAWARGARIQPDERFV